MGNIPDKLECEAYLDGVPARGVMLVATFEMSRKNPYHIIFGPVDSKGYASLEYCRILEEAKNQMEVAMMDYDPIESGFSGKISVHVMSENNLRSAIKAFQTFKLVFQYPEKHEENLAIAIDCPYTRQSEKIQIKVKEKMQNNLMH